VYRYATVFVISLILSGIIFGAITKEYSSDYSACLSLGNSELDCTNFITNSQSISKILDLSYAKVQDLNSYVSCVESEKQKSNFDYRSIKNICYSTQNDKSQSSFNKNRCFYDFDSNSNKLKVKCKGIFPSSDYVWDVVLQTDSNQKLLIEPKIILNPDFAITSTKLGLFVKDINLAEAGFNSITSSKISILPLSVEVKDIGMPLKSLFETSKVAPTNMDPIYRSYLDCITIHVLMSKQKTDYYLVKRSGTSYPQTRDQIYSTCRDTVSYAFAEPLESFDNKRNMFLDMLNVLVNNYFGDSDFSVAGMQSYFDNIDLEYKKYSSFESQISNDKDVPIKLSLDSDYFLADLQNATKNLSDEDRKTILASAGPTLLKNKEDILSIRHKTKLSNILDYFNADQINITDSDLKKIYFDIEYSLIKNHIDSSEIVDLTDVSAKLSSHSIALGQFSFDFTKPMTFDYNGNKDYSVLLTKNENLISMKFPDYNLNTALALGFENNLVYVGNKKVTFLDANVLGNISSGNVEINSVDLELDADTPVFVVHQQVSGKLLGIIKIKELFESRYFAATGILSDVSKPWWDFLVIYN